MDSTGCAGSCCTPARQPREFGLLLTRPIQRLLLTLTLLCRMCVRVRKAHGLTMALHGSTTRCCTLLLLLLHQSCACCVELLCTPTLMACACVGCAGFTELQERADLPVQR